MIVGLVLTIIAFIHLAANRRPSEPNVNFPCIRKRQLVQLHLKAAGPILFIRKQMAQIRV